MTAQELKNSILQLAVQGKLVPQDLGDEPASEPFKRIQTEKDKLIAASKIKPKKRLNSIPKEVIPFDIPYTWKWVYISDVTFFQEGPGILGKDFRDAGIPLIRIAGMQGLTVSLDGCNYLDPQMVLEKWNHFRLDKGDIVISTSASLDKIATVTEEAEGAIPYTGLIRFKMFKGVDPAYFVWFIKSPLYMMQIDMYKKGDAIKHYGPTHLQKMIMPLPPIEEQKRIVARIETLLSFVDEYDTLIKRINELNTLFPDKLCKSILREAVQGKLIKQCNEDESSTCIFQKLKKHHGKIKPCKSELDLSAMNFEIPSSWMMVELNQLFDFVDYRGKTPNKISEGVFLITASNIKRAYMDYSRKEYISVQEYAERQSRGITEFGDLLFTTEAPMGNTALCDLEECSCGQRVITFKEYEKETVVPALFMYFILSPQFQQQLLDNCTGATAKGIKADKLKHLLIPLPPYEEQKRIVVRIEELLAVCDKLK